MSLNENKAAPTGAASPWTYREDATHWVLRFKGRVLPFAISLNKDDPEAFADLVRRTGATREEKK